MTGDPAIDSLDRAVRSTLRIGLLAAVLLLAVGFLEVWRSAGSISGSASGPLDLATLAAMIGSGSGVGLLALGVLVLVVTPIARVLVSLAHFVEVRDARFILATAFVLGILALSVRAGLAP